ncbi:MAG: cytochrome-c peroxidase [Gemmatales bacterium]|nr:MAG: cytochrome-c peroxidase [Gemmatales bacterium]
MNRHQRTRLLYFIGFLLIFSLPLAFAWHSAAADDEDAELVAKMFPPDGPKIPLGLVPIIYPPDNPYSAEKAELGWLLFFDKRLSIDGTVSCASCHAPEHAFSNGEAVATGVRGQKGTRNSPTVINRAYSVEQFWDGRAATLEEQVKGPIANPIEMANTHENVVKTLSAIPGYRQRFKKVFGKDSIDIDDVAKAIATFERTVLSGNSPYDRYKNGDKDALTESQKAGMEIFFSNEARCDSCHEGINFTNGMFANIGVGMDKPNPDLGRYNVTKREQDKGAFKTPTLREIARTGPYMHDGSMKTLEEVVEHYNKGGIKNPWLHQNVRPLKLTDEQKKNLVDFLKALSGEGWQHIRAPKNFPK